MVPAVSPAFYKDARATGSGLPTSFNLHDLPKDLISKDSHAEGSGFKPIVGEHGQSVSVGVCYVMVLCEENKEISYLWGFLLLLNLKFPMIFRDNHETNRWSDTKRYVEKLGREAPLCFL